MRFLPIEFVLLGCQLLLLLLLARLLCLTNRFFSLPPLGLKQLKHRVELNSLLPHITHLLKRCVKPTNQLPNQSIACCLAPEISSTNNLAFVLLLPQQNSARPLLLFFVQVALFFNNIFDGRFSHHASFFFSF